MKDSTEYLLSEFYRILSTAPAINIPIFGVERDPASSDRFFINIASAYYLQSNTKSKYMQTAYINIDVVDKVPNNAISERRASLMSNTVVSTIIPNLQTNALVSSSEFSIEDVKNISGMTFKERDTEGLVIIKRLEFEIKVNIN